MIEKILPSQPFAQRTTRVLRLLATLTSAPVWIHPSQAAELVSGPMVGHTTATTAKIWVETDVPTYPLYELLSSNLGVQKEPIDTDLTGNNGGNHHSAANTFSGYNFGALSFSLKKNSRTITLQIIDESGKVRIHRRLSEKELKSKPR